MIGFFKKLAKKTLEDPKFRPIRYRISPNGSTVYSRDKEAAKKRGQELIRRLRERLEKDPQKEERDFSTSS